jgi:hypothetical protein
MRSANPQSCTVDTVYGEPGLLPGVGPVNYSRREIKGQREAFFKLTDSYLGAGKASRLEALKAEAQLDAERIC